MHESAQPPLQFPFIHCISLLPRHPSARHCLPSVGSDFAPHFFICFILLWYQLILNAARFAWSNRFSMDFYIFANRHYQGSSRQTLCFFCFRTELNPKLLQLNGNWRTANKGADGVGSPLFCFCCVFTEFAGAMCVAMQEQCSSDMHCCWIILFYFQKWNCYNLF